MSRRSGSYSRDVRRRKFFTPAVLRWVPGESRPLGGYIDQEVGQKKFSFDSILDRIKILWNRARHWKQTDIREPREPLQEVEWTRSRVGVLERER